MPLRLFFDECISKPAVDGLLELVKVAPDDIEIKHICDFQLEGIHDEVWLPQIAAEGWIVITADAGKQSKKKGEKLPNLCVMYCVTHVILSPRVHHQRVFDKTRALLAVWDDLLGLANVPRGSRYGLQLTNSGRAQLRLLR